jgi:hypothetical protein
MEGTKAYSQGMLFHFFYILLILLFFNSFIFNSFLLLHFFIFFIFHFYRLPGCLPHLASEKKQIKGLRPGVYRYHSVASELISSIGRSLHLRTVNSAIKDSNSIWAGHNFCCVGRLPSE